MVTGLMVDMRVKAYFKWLYAVKVAVFYGMVEHLPSGHLIRKSKSVKLCRDITQKRINKY